MKRIFCFLIAVTMVDAKINFPLAFRETRHGTIAHLGRTRTAFALPESLPANVLIQAASGLATYFGLVAFFDRPRGRLTIDTSCVEARPSRVEGAGLGLYVTTSLPEGTILGTYPGVVRPTHKYMQKYSNKPDAGVYAWRLTDNENFLDPTDSQGNLNSLCLGGTDDFPLSYLIHETILQPIAVPTLLARINEPPMGGGGCSVVSDEDLEKREVVFSLSRDVYTGEELYMDYGLTYDRSRYS
mmetsp:Transcript_21508/g.31700  ORF Transcript_21508/g.31700 Transcript_21508/m.31700 type:complete len:242 (-) Transcript_21508:157-882(-)